MSSTSMGVELRPHEVGHHGAHLFGGGLVTSPEDTRVNIEQNVKEKIGIALDKRRRGVSEGRVCVIDGEHVPR